MNEITYKKMMLSVDKTSDYGRGYQHGLRKFYHGEKFLDDWAGADMSHESRIDLRRGYITGLSGKKAEQK